MQRLHTRKNLEVELVTPSNLLYVMVKGKAEGQKSMTKYFTCEFIKQLV